MTNVRKPDFTLHREIGRTTYCIHGYFKQDVETTYADQLLMLIRNAAAKENQMETDCLILSRHGGYDGRK